MLRLTYTNVSFVKGGGEIVGGQANITANPISFALQAHYKHCGLRDYCKSSNYGQLMSSQSFRN